MGRRVAIIGLGKQGRLHLAALERLERQGAATVVGAYDPAVAPSDAPYAVASLGRLLSRAPDTLIVAVPNSAYAEVFGAMREVRTAGPTILKEKPLAVNRREALELQARLDGRRLVTAQQRFFDPAYRTAARWVAEKIGDPVRYDYTYMLNIQDEGWYWHRTAGGGAWLNMGWHLGFVASWMFGRADSVDGDLFSSQLRPWSYETDDTAYVRLRHEEGAFGSLAVSVVSPLRRYELHVIGSNGAVQLDRRRCRLLALDGTTRQEIPRGTELDAYVRQAEALVSDDAALDVLEGLNSQTMQIIDWGQQVGRKVMIA